MTLVSPSLTCEIGAHIACVDLAPFVAHITGYISPRLATLILRHLPFFNLHRQFRNHFIFLIHLAYFPNSKTSLDRRRSFQRSWLDFEHHEGDRPFLLADPSICLPCKIMSSWIGSSASFWQVPLFRSGSEVLPSRCSFCQISRLGIDQRESVTAFFRTFLKENFPHHPRM